VRARRSILSFGLIVPFALALVLQSCVGVSWRRRTFDIPIADATLASLEPGVSTLEECLGALGAPLYVWEYKGDGVALGYGWLKQGEVGVSASIPVADRASASFSFDEIRSQLDGAVLFFGPDLKLELVRRGYLREIAPLGRRRPAPVEEDGG